MKIFIFVVGLFMILQHQMVLATQYDVLYVRPDGRAAGHPESFHLHPARV